MREIWIRIEFNIVDKDMKHGGLKKKFKREENKRKGKNEFGLWDQNGVL